MANNKTYLDLCNRCLQEMYWTQVGSFGDLNTTEGNKIKNLLNEALEEIVLSEQRIWKFREQTEFLTLVGDQDEYDMIDGYILNITPPRGRKPLIYDQNYKYINTESIGSPDRYWIYEDKITFYPIPTPNEDGDLYKIRFLTDKIAKDSLGNLIDYMKNEDDEPLIPEEYRRVLVYAVCRDLRAKANNQKVVNYERKYNKVINDMKYSQTLTDDYVKGFRLRKSVYSNRDIMTRTFFDPSL